MEFGMDLNRFELCCGTNEESLSLITCVDEEQRGKSISHVIHMASFFTRGKLNKSLLNHGQPPP